jgi:O-antigen/teichoic acid export membrane protein
MISARSKTVRNMAANTAGVVVNMITGLLVMPFLIRTMGTSTYGLWVLIGTLTGYFGILDLGVSSALGRLVAAHRARAEHDEVNKVMSTGVSLLLIASLLVCVAIGVVLFVFPVLFNVPPSAALDVRYSIILVGLNLAFAFPGFAFQGFLWAHERFELINSIDIPILILRTILSLTLVTGAMPLTTLGAIAFGVTLLASALKTVACYRMDPLLHVSPRNFRRFQARAILSLGGWMSVISWSKTLIPQIAPTLIGIRVGSSAVTTFSVARQLVAYSNIFANSATQVMAPRAVAAHATNSVVAQKQLFIEGGKFSYALSLFFCGGFFCLGLPFIHWWQHGLEDGAYYLLLILLLGESLPMSQWLTYSVLLGANRQGGLGLLALSEGLVLVPLIVLLIWSHGVTGACIAVAMAGFLVRGVAQWLYGCKVIKVAPGAYARTVFLPVTIAAAVPVATLYSTTLLVPTPSSFTHIILLGAAYALLYTIVVGSTVLGYSRFKSLVTSVYG